MRSFPHHRRPRRIRLPTVALPICLLLVGASCKGGRRTKARRRSDAASLMKRPAARAAQRSLRSRSVNALLRYVPPRVQWFAAIGNVEGLTSGAARLWKLLAVVPDLGPAMQRVAGQMSRVLGAWPPSPKLWSGLGLAPGGGFALARVEPGAGLPGGTLAVALSDRPGVLLGRLVTSGRPRGAPPVGKPVPAAWDAGDAWWCGRARAAVVCGSDAALVSASLALPARRPGATLADRLPSDLLGGAELVGGWRAKPKDALSLVAARFTAWGLELEARVRGGLVGQWAGWLGSPRAPGPGPADRVAVAELQVDRDRIATLLGLFSKGSLPMARLAKQCFGKVLLVVGSGGWSMVAHRQSDKAAITTPERWTGSGMTFWVLAPARRLVVASSAAMARAALGKGGQPRLPAPLGKLLARRASAWLRLPLVDPLELLPASARVRLVVAIAGLPAGERAFVALGRALLTLAGEAGITVEKTKDGARVRVVLLSPTGGPTRARKAFAQLWQSKWQGSGFFDRSALRTAAGKHPGTGVGRVAWALTRLQLGTSSGGFLSKELLRLFTWLRGPEVGCAALAARLGRCREAFGRQLWASRWKELDSLAVPRYRRRLRKELLTRARRDAEALGAHCDRLAGRLENVAAVKRCLSAASCPAFAACLAKAFKRR